MGIYNSYREGRLPIRMEASLFSIQLLYTTHVEKADSLSEWRPLFSMQLLYTTHIENPKTKDNKQKTQGHSGKPKPRHRKTKQHTDKPMFLQAQPPKNRKTQ